MFWHQLALAIGGCTIGELKRRISFREAQNWLRYFMIAGPEGGQRMDFNFALLRQAVCKGPVTQPPTFGECMLKFDYRWHFPKDVETAIAEMVENIDADIEKLIGRFGKH